MAEERREARRTIAGAGLAVGLLALALFIFFLDDLIRLAQGRTTVVAVLEQAPNLRPNAPVWIAGQQVGTVSRLEFLPRQPGQPARLALALDIPSGTRQLIRADARVRITTARRIGEAVVDIVPGSGEGPPLADNDTLRPREGMSPAHVMARAAALRTAIDSLAGAAATLSTAARGRTDDVVRLQRSAAGIQAAFDRLSRDLQAGVGLARLRDPQLRDGVASLAVTLDRLSAALDSADANRSAHGAELGQGIDALRERAHTLSIALDGLRQLADESGSLARFRSDSAFVRALQGARAQLDSLVMEVRRNPARFVF